ncbi:MAG: Murein hydrolase activator NlpD [Chloroflexi bacterium]|nr:Murein hydrolase activator NlpD [Chloroflexota bacterium]
MENEKTQENKNLLTQAKEENSAENFWQNLVQTGFSEQFLRIGTYVGTIVLVGLVIFTMRKFVLKDPKSEVSRQAVLAEEAATLTPEPTPTTQPEIKVPAFEAVDTFSASRMRRALVMHTSIPTRPRVDVLTYTVEKGDSVFGIADTFGLKPETILWGNSSALGDNPHALVPDQELNILPVNGTYHKWREGENLQKVADFYGVAPLAIIEWPGNDFDVYNFDVENPEIEPGTMLIVPGGARELIDYGPPRIPRDNPAIARTYGPGHCGTILEGSVGVGTFIWPTSERWLSGFDYNPGANHPAIDIAGRTGYSIWAADNGVVVYAGWSNYGYGYLVVIDHGNGWQSLYAHLSAISVGCGQSVYQGTPIGSMGSTGKSSGAHLHFELSYLGQPVNPWNFLQ